VVSCLIPVDPSDPNSKGVLHELERLYPEEARERRHRVKENRN